MCTIREREREKRGLIAVYRNVVKREWDGWVGGWDASAALPV